MFNYLFPIFAFGLVLTGIVFLGLKEASDLAKNLAAERRELMNRAKVADALSPGRDVAVGQSPVTPSRP
jgi:hypothetical protein